MDEYEDYPLTQPTYAQPQPPNPVRGGGTDWASILKVVLPAIAGSISAKKGTLGSFMGGYEHGQDRIADERKQRMLFDQQQMDRQYNRQRQQQQDQRAEEQFNWQRTQAQTQAENTRLDNERADRQLQIQGDSALFNQQQKYEQEAAAKEKQMVEMIRAALAGPVKDPNFQRMVSENGDNVAIPVGDGSNMNVLEALRKVGHVFVDGKPFFEQPQPKEGGLVWERGPDGTERRVKDAPGVKRAAPPKEPKTPLSRKTTSYTIQERDEFGDATGNQIRIVEDAETGDEISRRVVSGPTAAGTSGPAPKAPTMPSIGTVKTKSGKTYKIEVE